MAERIIDRWTTKEKEDLLARIASGEVTRETARQFHGLSEEELAAWERDFDARGRAGLAVKRIQDIRRSR